MCELQLPFRLTGSFFGEAPGLPRTLAPTVQHHGYSCYGITLVAAAGGDECMQAPPAERDPAEGGVISLTSISQMTPPERFTEARRQKKKVRRALVHWCVVITNTLLLAASGVSRLESPSMSTCV